MEADIQRDSAGVRLGVLRAPLYHEHVDNPAEFLRDAPYVYEELKAEWQAIPREPAGVLGRSISPSVEIGVGHHRRDHSGERRPDQQHLVAFPFIGNTGATPRRGGVY